MKITVKTLFVYLSVLTNMTGVYAQSIDEQGNIDNYPDNIIEADCYDTPIAQKWKIKETPNSLGSSFSALQTPLVGDIDGDGEPEIIISNATDSQIANTLYIVSGDLSSMRSFSINGNYSGINAVAAIGRVKYSSSIDTTIVVILNNSTSIMYAYDKDGALLWTSDATYSSSNNGAAAQLVDLDGDGWIEILVGNKIFAAESGKLLCSAGTNAGIIHGWAGSINNLLQTVAGDVLGHGNQQVCIGNTIYTVNIVSRSNAASNSMTSAATLSPITIATEGSTETLATTDGATQLIDMDLDGHLDIVISTVVHEAIPTNSTFYIYVWSPHKNSIIASKKINRIYKRSVPFIGDIDGDKYPEIVFIHGGQPGNAADTHDYITALKYDALSVTGELNIFWQLSHNDISGATGITLFDFNQDGISELVYRDNTLLRIIDGSLKLKPNPYDLQSINCISATCYEYPVVADIDNDGQAEIIIVGATTGDLYGPLRVFEAGDGTKWAPARKVWNQYSYNAVNVNEDLTIPAYPLNPATFFPGENKTLCDDDDIQPYNSFLQQQTMLNTYGVPFWLTPNAEFAGTPPTFNYYAAGDSLVITVEVKNVGDAGLQAPFYVSAFKDLAIPENKIVTDSCMTAIPAGETKPVTVTIRKLSTHTFSKIIISLNTKDGATLIQPECKENINKEEYDENDLLRAQNDRASTIAALPVKVDVLANDSVPDGCTPVVSVVAPTAHGTAAVVNDSVQYVSDPGFVGYDTVTYSVACNGNTSVAKVIVAVVEKPDNILDANCTKPVGDMNWSINASPLMLGDNKISVYQTPYVGDLDNDDYVEIVVAKTWLDGEGNNCAPWGYSTNGIYVIDMKTQVVSEITVPVFASNDRGTIGLAKPNKNMDGYIVLAAMDGYLYAYNKASTSYLWKSNSVYTTYSGSNMGECDDTYGADFKAASIMFSDFDGDGNAEIVTGDRIFDMETGTLLLNCGFLAGKKHSIPKVSVVDVNQDGRPELVWGGNVYSIHIENRTGTANNTCTLLTSVTDATAIAGLSQNSVDATIPADFDIDGQVDILAYGKAYFYVYDPLTGIVKVRKAISTTPDNERGRGTPFVGDIDGDKYPEIMYGQTESANRNIIAYDIDGASTATVKWKKSTTDESRFTGLTLFDFDQNGTFEILYRDETQLRIFNGYSQATMDAATTPTITCHSATQGEYPVIADVDNDGEAEIIVTGSPDLTYARRGYVFIFNPGAGARWAPARKVWNQYAYNVVNINEDLTVPTTMFDVATVFPGIDEEFGTPDDVQPHNGFLKQATVINRNGVMAMYAADAEFTSTPPTFNYYGDGDSLVITIEVKNSGEAGLQAPFYFSAFKDAVNTANKIATDSCMTAINPGETQSVNVIIRNFSTHTFNKIVVRLNTKDGAAYIQAECNENNNDAEYNVNSILRAHNDYVSTIATLPVKIAVLANDSIPDDCTPVVSIVTTTAKYGTATLVNDSVRYTVTDPDFVGNDTIVTYSIVCNEKTSTAKVIVSVSEIPDNINEANCYVDPPAMTWGIELDWSSEESNISEFIIPLVGNLDDDQIPEIVCFNTVGRITIKSDVRAAKTMVIYDGRSHELKKTIELPSYVTEYDGAAYGLFRRPSDNLGLIVVATLDNKLRAYDINGKQEWISDVDYGSQESDFAVNIGFADFNMDGFPEVYVREKIYDASTGVLLAQVSPVSNTGSSWAHWTQNTGWKLSSPLAADVIGDAKPELILGNEIYGVNITNKTGTSGNSINLIRSATLPDGVTTPDGHAQVADFNLDGHLDILITNRSTAASNGGIVAVYVWDVFNNTTSSPLIINTTMSGKNIPLIAYVNNNDKLDIVLQCDNAGTNNDMQVYEYDAATKAFTPLWAIDPDEDSYSNSATLFDFNQDKLNEVLITDQSQVRIFRGSDGVPLNSFSFSEITIMQYPVIADVDALGSAKIVTCGSNRLNVFKSSGTPWAPARKVWNQYMYNAVNVNDDLTIPAYPLNPATVFPGADRLLGTVDDVRPYNNFLQQQTTINANGVPFWLTPNTEFVGTPPTFNYYAAGDSLVITVEVKNVGDAGLQAPFYVSAFKDLAIPENKIATDSCMTAIPAGETKPVTVTIRKLSTHTFNKIVVSLNTKDGVTLIQAECKENINKEEYDENDLLRAHNDYVSTIATLPVKIAVLANDSIPDDCTPVLYAITTPPEHGDAGFNSTGDTIIYTPTDPGFVGYDSLVYTISCGTKVSSAKVYIYISESPDNVSDATCFATPLPTDFSIKDLVSTSSNDLNVMTTPLTGDVDNDGEIEILITSRISTNSDAVVNSITELRIYGVQITYPYTPDAPNLYVKYTIPLEGTEFIPPGNSTNPTHFSNNTFYTFAKVDPPHGITGKRYAAIFLATTSGKLYKYEFNPSTKNYEATHSVMFNPSNRLYVGARPVLADLMGDGHVQVCILDKIYDAENLTLLATLRDADNNPVLPADHTLSSYSFGFISHGIFWNDLDYARPSLVVSIDDTDNDGKKEIIAGDCIYKVNITNYLGEVGNSYYLAVRANKQSDLITDIEARTDIYDGCGVIIDIDLDGQKDVVVVSRGVAGGGTGYLYVYNPLTGQVKNKTVTSFPASTSLWSGGPSFPFIGDLNNDNYPEICFGANGNNLYAFKYNPSTYAFAQFWRTTTSDDTGCIGLSLFDFEQDNQPEVVYRDNGHLYIWDGSKNPPTSVNPPVTGGLKSVSAAEYPVVADVNGDGFADIIVTGGSSDGFYGNLRVFTSAGAPWAPARSVWHMSPSQPLYINDDLTIPRYPVSPTTIFPGANGAFEGGDGDDVFPFNNYMQQSTSLDQNGVYLWLTPDAKFTETSTFTYYGDGDSLAIDMELTNIGDAPLAAPFYISAYANTVTSTNKMATDSSMITLDVEDTITTKITIRNYSSYTSLTKIIFRINDKGQAEYVQQECDSDNNTFEYSNFSDIPRAFNDTIATLKSKAVVIPVKANDLIPSGCSSVIPVIVSVPKNGEATIKDDSIKYTPNDITHKTVDSLVYSLSYTSNDDVVYNTEAKVYIIVGNHTSSYIACAGEKTPVTFDAVTNVSYYWYNSETGETPVESGSDTYDCEAPRTWWVEARFNGKPVKPRFDVVVGAYQALVAGLIDDKNQTICNKEIPDKLEASSPTGGNGTYSYQWQQSPNGVDEWEDIDGAENTTYSPPALTADTYYRLNVTSCTTESSNVVKIRVYPASLFNYPDIRIRVCPDAGTLINLSKYIDTLAVTSLNWESVSPPVPIIDNVAGTISADNFNPYSKVYTFTYTANNLCLSEAVKSKVYLEILKPDRMRPLKDTIAICYECAEAVQINQIFGIDARGTWSYKSAVDHDIDTHVKQSTSETYSGAVIMNGKAVCDDSSIGYYSYHGEEKAKKVEFTYKTDETSCLKGKEYTIVIILTPNIMQ